MTQFPEWLAALGREGEALELPALSKDRDWAVIIYLPASEDYGLWLGGTFSMDLKATPDIDATVLASCTCNATLPVTQGTPVTVTLLASAQTSIPDETDSAIGELFYDLVYTPTGGSATRAVAGRIPMISGVT